MSATTIGASNLLLQTLSSADFSLVEPSLELVHFDLGQRLVEPDEPIAHVWFPETMVVSVIAATPGGRKSEVGLTGREGMVDIGPISGSDVSPFECLIQVAGSAWQLPVTTLRGLIENEASVRSALMLYLHAFVIQVSHTALVNAAHSLDQRLARLLLMTHDRIDGPIITMTHQLLSTMLGVRRAGVTVAMRKQEKDGLIRTKRSSIEITNRAKLEALAADAYGLAEKEYCRLIGTDFRRKSAAGLQSRA
nr:Crp/Fnr family transcriptional regulator [Polymorphobacter sp.]